MAVQSNHAGSPPSDRPIRPRRELYLLSPRRYTVYHHHREARGHRTAPRRESSASVFCAEMVSHKHGCGDLHNIPDALNPERDFDLVVFSQTMEHLYDPLLAARNLLRVMRPGGHLFTSAPVQSRPHMTPYTTSSLTRRWRSRSSLCAQALSLWRVVSGGTQRISRYCPNIGPHQRTSQRSVAELATTRRTLFRLGF